MLEIMRVSPLLPLRGLSSWGPLNGEFLLIALNVFEKSYVEDNLFSCFTAQSLGGAKEAGYLGSLGYLETPTLLVLLLSWQLRAPQECQTGPDMPQLLMQPPTGQAWGPPSCGNR